MAKRSAKAHEAGAKATKMDEKLAAMLEALCNKILEKRRKKIEKQKEKGTPKGAPEDWCHRPDLPCEHEMTEVMHVKEGWKYMVDDKHGVYGDMSEDEDKFHE
ncbi:hypothetical protein KRP22_015035 [Phytophthora ramorum]|nr:hypothetical protein KRP22_4817 [Phytophthora ramorum]